MGNGNNIIGKILIELRDEIMIGRLKGDNMIVYEYE